MGAPLDPELEEVLAKLGPDERRQVLDYARSLQDDDESHGANLMEFVGSITREDAQLMREVIEEEFETVHGAA